MHLKRLIIAVILVPLLYLYVTRLPVQYTFGLITVVASIGLYEFYSMFGLGRVLKYLGILWGIVLLYAGFRQFPGIYTLLLIAGLTVLSVRLFMKGDPVFSMTETSTTMLGLIYVPGLMSFQINLALQSQVWIIFLYGTVWASDSAAYYVGKGMGRHKLYEAVSPNKTMEGGVGSLIGGVVGGIILKYALGIRIPIYYAALMGLAIGAATIIGDLVESMYKRDAGVKDSGGIIPGHGGVLDKIDGATFAGPAFFFVCKALRIF